MDPVTMMVASIGMQFFNNYANNKKNEEIQEKQREFQRAAAEHDFERMRKLQAESAKLALELEAEVHQERVEDINGNYDALLDNFANSFAIQNWPLNVLPFVMKGESFGTLFNGTTQSVNLHCIFTPSNCEWFNKNFYDDIDLRLEAEMNNKWNAQTTHPIVYYGGAWNRRSMNKGISFPNSVDLDDIELLRIKLKDVPVVVVTPYFDPWLHFKVRLWGMGKDSETPYRIDIPHGDDIEFSQRIFSYNYHKDDIEITEDFENTTIEELVPYLECLIGFIADKYFWSMYGIVPQIPSLLSNEMAKTSYQIYKDYYLSYVNKNLLRRSIVSYQDIKNYYSYIESVRQLTTNEQYLQIQNHLLQNIRKTYILSDTDIDYPKTYSELPNFIDNEEKITESFSWVKFELLDKVDYTEFVDRFDLVEYLKKFKDFVDLYRDRFDLNYVSIYIKHLGYKEFELHVYDLNKKLFLKSPKNFNYKIQTNRPIHMKKLKYIFKNKESGDIVCRYMRIEKMVKVLQDINELIY